MENAHEKRTENKPQDDTATNEQNNRFQWKAPRMNTFVSLLLAVLLALAAICVSIVIANHGKPEHHWNNFWWGIAAYGLLGLVVFFGYYYFVIRVDALPKENVIPAPTPIPTLTERPWLSVEVVPNGPILFSRGTPNLSVKFIIKNDGHSVANEVTVRAQVFIAEWGNGENSIHTAPVKRQKTLCESLEQKVLHKQGVTIFPNKTEEMYSSFGLNRQEMEAYRIAGKDGEVTVYGTVPVLVGCIDYAFGDKPFRGQTGFIYEAHIFDPARDPAHPLFIRIGNDVPMNKLALVKYFFGGDYAN
jgi:hypothetical protein